MERKMLILEKCCGWNGIGADGANQLREVEE